MNTLLLNPHVLSPQDFRPVAGSTRPVPVPSGSVWGRSDVARLRTAGWVEVVGAGDPRTVAAESTGWGRPSRTRPTVGAGPDGGVENTPQGVTPTVPGACLGDDQRWALTVHALALAGVPTTAVGLPEQVRRLLDAELLEAADAVDAETVSDRERRELASLTLRRAAWRTGPGRWYLPQPATVLVLLPETPSPSLLADLAAQQGVRVEQAVPGGHPGPDGVDFVTSVRNDLRYSTHHLADLVHGLLHSGAEVVHSPDRFRRHGHGAWLEQEGVSEGPAPGGLTGGSLWHAVSGIAQPPGQGYAVHGTNAVPGDLTDEDRPGVLRWHPTRPLLLRWLGPQDQGDRSGAGEPGASHPAPSYPARKLAGVQVPDRTPSTAAEN